MRTIHQTTDPRASVLEALQDTITCTAFTCDQLRGLLGLRDGTANAQQHETVVKGGKPSNPRTQSNHNTKPQTKNAAKTASVRAVAAANEASDTNLLQLNVRERRALATDVVNAALSALNHLVQHQNTASTSKADDATSSSTSNGTQQTKRLQERSANLPSPRGKRKPIKAATLAQRSHTKQDKQDIIDSVAHCCSDALSFLSSESPNSPSPGLEQGSLAFVSKLIALRQPYLAAKGLKVLKQRLIRAHGVKAVPVAQAGGAKVPSQATSEGRETLISLLQVIVDQDVGATLSLVTFYQMLVLQAIALTRKSALLNALIPALNVQSASSPFSIVIRLHAHEGYGQLAERQLEAFTKLLLSLCPGLSRSQDQIASGGGEFPKLSTAFALQALALEARALRMRLARCQALAEDELLAPLQKCLIAYIRRSSDGPAEAFATVSSAAESLIDQALSLSDQYAGTKKCGNTRSALIETIASVAEDAGLYADALRWTEKERVGSLDRKSGSNSAAVLALQRATAALKSKTQDMREEPDQQLTAVHTELELINSLTAANVGLLGAITDLQGAILEQNAKTDRIMSAMRKDKGGELGVLCTNVLDQCLRLVTSALSQDTTGSAEFRPSASSEQLIRATRRAFDFSIRAALSVAKSQDGDRLLFEDQLKRLQRCEVICQHTVGDSKDQKAPTRRLLLSNAYIGLYLSSKATMLDLSTQFLRRSCAVLNEGTSTEKADAGLLTRLATLAKTSRDQGRWHEACSTWHRLVHVCIETEVLEADIQTTAWNASGTTSSKQYRVLEDALSNLLEVSARRSVGILGKDGFFDDFVVASTIRWLLLECQLRVALGWLAHDTLRTHAFEIVPTLTSRMLDGLQDEVSSHQKARMLALSLRSSAQQSSSWEAAYVSRLMKEAAQLLEAFRSTGTTSNFVERHFCATIRVLLGLSNNTPPEGTFNEALHEWEATLEHLTGAKIEEAGVDTHWWLDLVGQACEKLHSSGQTYLRLAFSHVWSRVAKLAGVDDVPALLDLAMQYLELDQTQQAGVHLERVRKRKHLEPGTVGASSFWLASVKYHLYLGLCDQADQDLQEAWEALRIKSSNGEGATPQQSVMKIIQRACDVAQYHQLCAEIVLARGIHAEAIRCSKLRTVTLQRVWRILQSLATKHARTTAEHDQHGTTAVTLDLAALDLSDLKSQRDEATSKLESCLGLSPIIAMVLRRLLGAYVNLAELQGYSGLFLDAAITLDQAQRATLGLDLGAPYHDASIRKGDLLIRSGCLEKGAKELQTSEFDANKLEIGVIQQQRCLGHYFHIQKQWKPELAAYDRCEEVIRRLALEAANVRCKIKDDPPLLPSAGRPRYHARSVLDPRTPSRKPKTKHPTSRPNSSGASQSITQSSHSDTQAMLLCLKAQSFLAQHDLTSCKDVLDNVNHLSQDSPVSALTVAVQVQHLLQEAMAEVASDSVLAMLPESTISIPAARLTGGNDLEVSFNALNLGSPQQKPFRTPRRAGKPSSPSAEVARRLREVCGIVRRQQNLLVQRLPLAALMTVRSTVVSASMMLAYVGSDTGESFVRPAFVSFWLDLPRSVAAYRERSTLLGERQSKLLLNNEQRVPNSSTASGTFKILTECHGELLELLPRSWSVVSLSLDATAMHLLITRYDAGRPPLVVRLPLARQSEDMGEEETLSFSDARNELQDIIAKSDLTVHSARDDPNKLKVAGARTQWWADREGLNERLRNLLHNIESMWLGGFRSLFSQQQQSVDLLSRFQQTFDNTLDKHLPSRQKLGQRANKDGVKLDRHVLELFTALTERMTAETDLEEALTDLLYFVVDILQFHGEPNAYDEIDFDAIIVEIQSALAAYRQAFESIMEQDPEYHTILVLDKELHMFPWESMPCLQDKSVSRVHSLFDLHERLVAMRTRPIVAADRTGIYLSPTNGTYVLNPGCDLQQTQMRFEEPLSTLSGSAGWSGVVARAPTEADMLSGLTREVGDTIFKEPDNPIFLYIGHGSGEQYIRHRKIKGLRYAHLISNDADPPDMTTHAADGDLPDVSIPSTSINNEPAPNRKVSAALLFGCSSASLRLHSEFEPDGTPKSYMAAGAPAILGSLWDVTDGDVDRLAGAVLERWGLFGKGTFVAHEAKLAKGKKKTKTKRPEEVVGGEVNENRFGSMCLSEAVARSRDSCYLKYLNGAAMVVYGVPVYLDKRV